MLSQTLYEFRLLKTNYQIPSLIKILFWLAAGSRGTYPQSSYDTQCPIELVLLLSWSLAWCILYEWETNSFKTQHQGHLSEQVSPGPHGSQVSPPRCVLAVLGVPMALSMGRRYHLQVLSF